MSSIFKVRRRNQIHTTSGPGTATPSLPSSFSATSLVLTTGRARQCRPSVSRPPPSSRRPLPLSCPQPLHLQEVKCLPLLKSFMPTQVTGAIELVLITCLGFSSWFLQALCQQRLLLLPRPPAGRAPGSPPLRARTGAGSLPALLHPVVSFFNDLTLNCTRR